MAIYSNSRLELRHLLANLMHDHIVGVVASPASGTFVCATTHWDKPDDHFNDYLEVFDYSGTGIGTSGNPTNWVQSTHTLTFSPVATLTAGDLVEIHQRFTVEEYNNAINHAIDLVANEALLDRVNETITLVTGTYQYNIPTQFLYIDELRVSDDNGDFTQQTPLDNKTEWRPVKATQAVIEFIKGNYNPVTGRKLRITGSASPGRLETDAEECPIDPEYVIQSAKSFLHQSRIRGNTKDPEDHQGQMQLARVLAQERVSYMSANRTGVAIVEI